MLPLLRLREAAGEEREVRQRRGARHLSLLVSGGFAGPAAVSEVTVPNRAQPCSTQAFYAAFSLAICYPPASVAASLPARQHPRTQCLIGSCCRAGCCDNERESTPRRFFYFRLQAFYTLFPLAVCFFAAPFRRPYGRGRCRARRPARQRA